MRANYSCNVKRIGRGQHGQGLLEGVCGLVFFSGIFVACLLLFLNTYVLSECKLKMQTAATEAAKVYDAQHYFLGQVRKDFNPTTAEQKASEVADAAMKTLGLPPMSGFNIETVSVSSTSSLTAVTITIDKIPTIGNMFAPFVALQAKGVCWDGAAPPYGVMQLGFNDPAAGGVERFVYVPMYGVSSDPSGKFGLDLVSGQYGGAAIELQNFGDSAPWYWAGGNKATTINPW